MVSMKLSKSDKTEEAQEYQPPDYPYGLQISLDGEQIEKLGLEGKTVGDEVVLVAKAKITSSSSHQSEGGKKHHSCSLQITDMEATAKGGDSKSASKLYPDA